MGRYVPDHPQDVLSENWGVTEQNRNLICMVLKAKANNRRSAKNGQLTGKKFNYWITWKTAPASRFKRRITIQEFLAHQNEQKLRHNESLVDLYLFKIRYFGEKTPFTIPQSHGISMMIGDITEEKWQSALATQNSNTVEELTDGATALDAFRSSKQKHKKHHSPKPEIRSSYTHDERRRKYNPITDDVRYNTC
ncbi:uncharacterized protein TNCV_3795911 [Trichonephila clavipes]|nr:uncharacterized protein TNCV_3795911 [Trichonephila clavipes]